MSESTRDPSRRDLLRAGGIIAATAAGVAGFATWRAVTGQPAEDAPGGTGSPATGSGPPGESTHVSGAQLAEPTVLAATDGLLEVDLTAARGVSLAGRSTQALGYNGTSPGPTLRVAPGDTLRIHFVNRLDETTNLHTHGLHVSPTGSSDNVFRMAEPGATLDYEYAIPPDHPSGTFWYHPHHHGLVAEQVFGGLFGAIIVAGRDEPPAAAERVLVVSDTTLDDAGRPVAARAAEVMAGREGRLVLVNGQSAPRLELPLGTTQRWRVLNACASRFLQVQLDDHELGLLGRDGQALGAPRRVGSVLLAPGNRADLLVSSDRPGEHVLRTRSVDRGGMGGSMMGGPSLSREVALATVVVSATAAGSPSGMIAWSPAAAAPDLRDRSVDRTRTVTLTMGMGPGMGSGMSFGIDGRSFDPGRVDLDPRLGTVEDWMLVNPGPLDHPFHLHVWPMQVLDDPDTSGGPPDWRDVVVVPAGRQVRVRIAFRDFGGRAVFHCHVLDHEDRGMMGVIEVA